MDGSTYFPMRQSQSDLPAPRPVHAAARRVRLQAASAEIERIYLGMAASQKRVVGVVDCGASGTAAALAQALAERGSASGEPTLYLDLTQPLHPDSSRAHWLPGDGRAARSIEPDARGFDRLTGWACPKTAMKFRNLGALRQLLAEELGQYHRIVVDAGNMMDDAGAVVPPVTVAQVCEGLIVTASPNGIAAPALKAALANLGAARENVIGVVLDDCDNPTVGEQLATSLRRRFHRLPWLAAQLSAMAQRSGLLSQRV